jgi:dihydroxy-acid dehydratase
LVVIDIDNRRLDIEVSEDEIARRLSEWKQPTPRYQSGVLAKYASLVMQANEGAITRPIL